jgi:hypothetical protein
VRDDAPTFIDPAEDCPMRTPREILARQGYTPPAPHELSERQLPGRLWELLYAAAARRLFFDFSDHLSDRQFYALLWEQWIDEPVADIPLEAETNTTLLVAELNAIGMTHEEIWLRYYADDRDRALMAPGEAVPPHEHPPFNRDRFLPTPPIPLETDASWLSDGDDDPSAEDGEDESDPLGLAEVDREIAAAKIDSTPGDTLPLDPPNTDFAAHLRAAEPGNWRPPAEQLVAQNVPLLPPDEITEETLTPILWELLHNLALRGFYVLHTDHLSDRELYAELWQQGLREPAYLPGRNPRGAWIHDFLGSWGDDEMQLWLRHYASDEERAQHAQEWPNDAMPPKEKPISNRDWRLPKGPF